MSKLSPIPSNNLVQNLTALNELPKSWQVSTFQEAVKDCSSGNKKTLKSDFLEEGSFAIVDQGQEKFAGFTNDESLLVKSLPPYIVFGDHTRIFKYIDVRFAMGADGTKVLKPKIEGKVHEKFLYYFFLTLNIPDTGYNRHFKHLKKAKIPLPPLDEQKKIAAILDAADALRQKDAQLIAKYNDLSQSLFLDMFGDPVTNPMGWKSTPFEKCLNDIIGGKSVGGDEHPIKDGEKAVLKISAVTSGYFNCLEYKVVEAANIPDTLILPYKGDLLFSRANTRELVGATCIVDADYSYLFLPDKLWKLDLMENRASAEYIRFLLTHEGFRSNLKKVATGTSGSMLNISKTKLKALKVPLPPITLQNQFAERIQAIEVQKQQAQAALQKSEDLFNSLLQRAFKGELTA